MNPSDKPKKISNYNIDQSSQVDQSMKEIASSGIVENVKNASNSQDYDVEEIASSGIVKNSLQVGDRTPDFTLIDTQGETIQLQNLLRSGAVVVSFFRGDWCSYCSLELRALEEILPAILNLDASLISISPQTSRRRRMTPEENLTHPILIDIGNQVARQFGIVYQMGESVRELYAEFNISVAMFNGDETYELPVPATFIIDKTGIIAYRYVDPDYRRRIDPIEIISVLAKLKQ